MKAATILMDSQWTYIRYGLACFISLGMDISVFLISLHNSHNAAVSAALGYMAGIIINWAFLTGLVFKAQVAKSKRAAFRQKIAYLLSTLLGLTITTLIVYLGSSLGVDAKISKLVAIGMSFQIVWLFRRHCVFA